MHISEGVLSTPVLIGCGLLSFAGTSIRLKKIDYDKVMTVALFSSTFFVASFIHVPIGPASVHLLLSGLVGLILGWSVFPAILASLSDPVPSLKEIIGGIGYLLGFAGIAAWLSNYRQNRQ